MMKGERRAIIRILWKQILGDFKDVCQKTKSIQELFNKIRPENYNDLIAFASDDELKNYLMEGLDCYQKKRLYNIELKYNSLHRIMMNDYWSNIPEVKLRWYFRIASIEQIIELWNEIAYDEQVDFLKLLLSEGNAGALNQFIADKLDELLGVISVIGCDEDKSEILRLVAGRLDSSIIAKIFSFAPETIIQNYLVDFLTELDRISYVLSQISDNAVLFDIVCNHADLVMPKLKGQFDYCEEFYDYQLEKILSMLIDKKADLNEFFDLEQMAGIYAWVSKEDAKFILENLMRTEPKYKSLTIFYETLEKSEQVEMLELMTNSRYNMEIKYVLETVKKSRELHFTEELLLKHLSEEN